MTEATRRKLQLALWKLSTKSLDPKVLKMVQSMRLRYPELFKGNGERP